MTNPGDEGDAEDVHVDDADREELARVVADVPKTVKEAAQDKLEYGGLTREVEELLERIAFGEDLGQRSRIERRLEQLDDEMRGLREERRELDAQIENTEQQRKALEQKLSNLTTKEDKFDAKLEELESRLLDEGTRLDPDHPAVKRAAATGGTEPEGVIEELKERNPEVPGYAFKQAMHDTFEWNGRESLDTPFRDDGDDAGGER